jgi:hypothetical protein
VNAVPSVDEVMAYYFAISPKHQAAVRDYCFRQWALRADDDAWGQLCGSAFDLIELARRPAGGQA